MLFEGKNLLEIPAHQRVSAGLVQVPEGRRVFSSLSVAENLDLGAYTRKDKAQVAKDLIEVYELFPRLAERKNQAAGTMSGGEQQMLAVGRAMMSNPRLLLLDEPSLGLAPLLVKEIFNVIKRIRERGVTVLLVEQNAHMSLAIRRPRLCSGNRPHRDERRLPKKSNAIRALKKPIWVRDLIGKAKDLWRWITASFKRIFYWIGVALAVVAVFQSFDVSGIGLAIAALAFFKASELFPPKA